MGYIMKVLRYILAPVAAFAIASAAQAAETMVVIGSCDSVTDGDTSGCLFTGNINGNDDPNVEASYLNAQDAYNEWATSFDPDLETITLNWLTKNDDGNFGDFGGITVDPGGHTGTFDLSGWNIEYYAVKAGSEFVLYEYLGTDGTGNWAVGGRNGMSHIAFFGTPGTTEAPEPGTWAMMLLGFGAVGGAMRRRRRGTALQIA